MTVGDAVGYGVGSAVGIGDGNVVGAVGKAVGAGMGKQNNSRKEILKSTKSIED